MTGQSGVHAARTALVCVGGLPQCGATIEPGEPYRVIATPPEPDSGATAWSYRPECAACGAARGRPIVSRPPPGPCCGEVDDMVNVPCARSAGHRGNHMGLDSQGCWHSWVNDDERPGRPFADEPPIAHPIKTIKTNGLL